MAPPKEFATLGIKDDKGVINFCNWSIAHMGLEAVFCFLAHEFSAKPTAAKAKELATIFLTKGTQTEVNHNNDAKYPLPNNKALAAALQKIKTLSDYLKNAKTEAEQILVIEGVALQGDLKPLSKMFDDAHAAVAGGLGDPYGRFAPWKPEDLAALFSKGTKAPGGAGSFVTKTWEPARKKLEAAGFDVKAFVMPGIK